MRKPASEIIAENLAAAMLDRHMVNPVNGQPSQSALARKAHVDQRTVGRILNREQSPTIEMLEKLAHALDLDAWQMMIPSLDPKNPPVFVLSRLERDFYRRLDELRCAEPPTHRYNVNHD